MRCTGQATKREIALTLREVLDAYENNTGGYMPAPCAHHTIAPGLDRTNATLCLIDLNARLAAGETKTRCPDCSWWLWADEVGVAPTGETTDE